MSLVDIRNINLEIEGRAVLRNVTLRLTERRIALIGSNGSGKSTLARVVTGLVAPDTGTSFVNDIDVFGNRISAISEIGIIFQNPDHQIIFPTVEEDIAFGPRQLGMSKSAANSAAHEILNRFGVLSWAERSIATLSQGQKHLVCMLSVLVMNPSVLIMDEPFTGLDLKTTRQLVLFLEALEQTVIHVTHDLDAISNYERAIWLEDGAVAGDSTPKHVVQAYKRSVSASEACHAVTHLAS